MDVVILICGLLFVALPLAVALSVCLFVGVKGLFTEADAWKRRECWYYLALPGLLAAAVFISWAVSRS